MLVSINLVKEKIDKRIKMFSLENICLVLLLRFALAFWPTAWRRLRMFGDLVRVHHIRAILQPLGPKRTREGRQ